MTDTDKIWAEILAGPESERLPNIMAKQITQYLMPKIRELLITTFCEGADFAINLYINGDGYFKENWAYKEALTRFGGGK